MRKLILLLAFLGLTLYGVGQTTTIDFETEGEGYTPDTTFGTGSTDVFNRVNPDIGGNSSYIWAAEDISRDPHITLDQIDVTDVSSFSFSIDFLTPNSDDWDSTDELLITYSVDDGSSQNLMWVQNTGETNNAPAALDLDFNGDGDIGQELPALVDDYGAGVGNTFETFYTSDIMLSNASTLDITLQFYNLTANDEGIYIDNIKMYKDPPSISNITQNPSENTNITSDESVSVSADVTDDSSVSDVELHWGTSSGNLNTTINMTKTSGDTYKTDSDIPAQSDGTKVYYEIKATDDDAGVTLSEEKNYQVQDPVSTPYNEDFSGQNGKGAIGGDAVTYDLDGVDWTLNISESGLTASTDWFKVEEEKFSARDIDEEQIWYSPYIDISGMNAIEISVDVSSVSGELESGDYIETGYEIDDGSFVTITEHEGEIDGTLSDQITLTDLSNDILRIVIKVLNNVGGEYYYFDNISAYTVNSFNSTTGNWNTASNWGNGTVPTASENVIIPSDGEVTIASDETATCNGLTIESDAGETGSLTINSSGSGTGSLIVNGTVSGSATVERYIEGYTDASNGWHLLSPPVGTFTINNNADFDPGDNDDVYGWSESSYTWMNHKQDDPSDMVPGTGYLVSYESTNTRNFTGTLNNSDITHNDLSVSQDGNGWHLLGNPFPSALKWEEDADWNLNNIATGAKIMNSGGSYTDVTTSSNQYIPAHQGFFVQATDGTNNITIPTEDRAHNSTSFYKSEVNNLLTLKASQGNKYVETWLQMKEGATVDYDEEYDIHFLGGMEGTPYLYSIADNEEYVSTNRIPHDISDTEIPLGFKVFNDGEVTMEWKNLDSFENDVDISLTDLKTEKTINLDESDSYTFTASTDDDVNRFVLNFKSAIGIDEQSDELEGVSIYSHDNRIFVNSGDELTNAELSVYNTLGQLVSRESYKSGDKVISVDQRGAYIVRIQAEEGVATQKVIIQ